MCVFVFICASLLTIFCLAIYVAFLKQSFLVILWLLLEIKDINKDFSPHRKKNRTTMLRFAVTLLAVITSSTCQKYGCLEGDTHKLKPSPEPKMHECTLYSKCKSGLIIAQYSLEVQLYTH